MSMKNNLNEHVTVVTNLGMPQMDIPKSSSSLTNINEEIGISTSYRKSLKKIDVPISTGFITNDVVCDYKFISYPLLL